MKIMQIGQDFLDIEYTAPVGDAKIFPPQANQSWIKYETTKFPQKINFEPYSTMSFKLDGCSYKVAHSWTTCEETDTIIAEILSAWEKAECYDEVANHFQRNFTLIKKWCFFTFMP